jgi:hypothetical protein
MEKLLEPYINRKTENEYIIKYENKFLPSFVTLFKNDKIYTDILDKDIINTLNPNNINSQEFWYNLQKHFKYSPICGKISSSIEEVNYNNLTLPKIFRIFDEFKEYKFS